MVAINCVFLFLNAATVRGIIGQTHVVYIKKSQYIHYIVLKEQIDVFLGKNVKKYFRSELTKGFSSMRLLGVVKFRSRVKGLK